MSYDDVTFILGQPSVKRFVWEAEVCLTSLFALLPEAKVVMVWDKTDVDGVLELSQKFPKVKMFLYDDERQDKSYPATTRPYLFCRLFSHNPKLETGNYIQIETDIIFRQLPKLPELDGDSVFGADCGGYIDYDYLRTRKNGEMIIDGMAEILSVDRKLIERTPGIGAQYFYSNPTADLWWHIWQDSNLIKRFLDPIDSDIQKWTAEMWAQVYNFAKDGYSVAIDKEFNHCTPTDNIDMWDQRNILHNAGVVGEGAHGLFYKGGYTHQSPFNEDLSWVRRDKVGWHYARAIEKAARNL